jgi:hypothetical protein
MSEVAVSCWCCAVQRQVHVQGTLVGKRQVDVLQIRDCEQEDCPKRGALDCLIGKLLEGRWS